MKPSRSKFESGDGIDFVRCRICGKHLCVINGRHLSTHGTDRETYIEEYRLSPDQLCSKTFRINHSSRSDYYPHNKREWVAAMKMVYKQHGNVYAGFLQKHYPNLYVEGLGMRLSVYSGSHQNECGYEPIGRPKGFSRRSVSYGKGAYLSIRHTS